MTLFKLYLSSDLLTLAHIICLIKLVFNIFDVKDQRWFGKTLKINLDNNLIKYVLKIFFWRPYLFISKKKEQLEKSRKTLIKAEKKILF